jgi:hypothetical protein
MATIPGTIVSAKVTTGDTANTYPVADQSEIRGGNHSVETLTDRDNIPAERRMEGMTCWVGSEGKEYRLVNGTNNGDWLEVVDGGGASGTYVLKTGDTMSGRLEAPAFRVQEEVVVFGTSVVANFDGKAFQTGTLTSNGTFSTTNRGLGKQVALRIFSDGTDHELVTTSGIRSLKNPPPFFLQAGKIAIASFASFGASENDTVMVFVEEG